MPPTGPKYYSSFAFETRRRWQFLEETSFTKTRNRNLKMNYDLAKPYVPILYYIVFRNIVLL